MRRNPVKRRAIIVTVLSTGGAVFGQPFFESLGHLKPEDPYSFALGLSADAGTVVGEDFEDAFVWTPKGGLDRLKGMNEVTQPAWASGVSADGRIAVGYDGDEPIRWVNRTPQSLKGPLGGAAKLLSVSATGSVAVGSVTQNGVRQALLWSAKTGKKLLVGLDDQGESVAKGVSGDGAVVVGWGITAGQTRPFRWTLNGMKNLGTLNGGGKAWANAVSANGSVVVGAAYNKNGQKRAFRWANGAMTDLGLIAGMNASGASEATAVSADGSVIVGFVTYGENQEAFVYEPKSGMQFLADVLGDLDGLDMNGWTLYRADGLSADGNTFTGTSYNPEGNVEAWAASRSSKFSTTTERASISQTEAQALGDSAGGSLGAGGNLVAFASAAANLVPGDTNGRNDIFVRNRSSGWTSRVSVSKDGAQANGASDAARLSANDGLYVVFVSVASNLVPGDTNGKADIFLRNRQSGTIQRISVSTAGVQANEASAAPEISADGRFVVYHSNASNLVYGDTNGTTDVFIWDRLSSSTSRVSVGSTGGQANGPSTAPSLSNDGRYIAFTSTATNLVGGDTNGAADIFLRDRSLGTTVRASLNSIGQQANGNSSTARISANGRYVAFRTSATNIVDDDKNAADDVVVRDRANGTTTRASVGAGLAEGTADSWPAGISGNGRFVLFTSAAPNLVQGDTNSAPDAFVHDMWTLKTIRVSVGTGGQQATAAALAAGISPDGRFVTFTSAAGNLVNGDTGGFSDVFLRDLRRP
jgi:probable HAF family extracellular repeat protein